MHSNMANMVQHECLSIPNIFMMTFTSNWPLGAQSARGHSWALEMPGSLNEEAPACHLPCWAGVDGYADFMDVG